MKNKKKQAKSKKIDSNEFANSLKKLIFDISFKIVEFGNTHSLTADEKLNVIKHLMSDEMFRSFVIGVIKGLKEFELSKYVERLELLLSINSKTSKEKLKEMFPLLK